MHEQWQRFRTGVGGQTPLPSFILESWERCHSWGVRTGQSAVPRVGDEETGARVRAKSELIRAAHGHLRWLGTAVAHLPFHCVMLTDQDGVIVDSSGNQPEVMQQFGLCPGANWSERSMGTNGIGTSLAERRPVAVVGSEHYLNVIHNYTCVGAPIMGPDGAVTGALDLCTTAADGDPTRLVIVAYAAQVIARELASAGEIAGRVRDHVSVVAHELGTSLTALTLLSQRLLRATSTAPDVHPLAERVDRQMRKLVTLADGLLRASAGTERVDGDADAQTSLAALVREVAVDFEEVAARTGRPLVVSVPEAPPARWNRRKLQQIATNLVSNAFKYGERGPVDLCVEPAGSHVRIVVRDHGPGIPPEDRARLLERWQRGGGTLDRPGAGLGLWIVAELARSMGGGLEIGDNSADGAVFVVTLPVPKA